MRTHSPESRSFAERVQLVMDLTSRLNVLPFGDIETRNALLSEILGRPLPATVTIYSPFYSDHGLGIEFGERVFVNQGCYFLDLGGITIGDRTMIGPRVKSPTGSQGSPSPNRTLSERRKRRRHQHRSANLRTRSRPRRPLRH